MIHELIPWGILTRTGIPALKVSRRPLVLGPITVEVGQTLNPEVLPLQIRKERLRQFYEARLVEPVDAPKDSRQFYRERQGLPVLGTVVAPITPVASQIVADLPTVDVPVAEEPTKRKSKGGK